MNFLQRKKLTKSQKFLTCRCQEELAHGMTAKHPSDGWQKFPCLSFFLEPR